MLICHKSCGEEINLLCFDSSAFIDAASALSPSLLHEAKRNIKYKKMNKLNKTS